MTVPWAEGRKVLISLSRLRSFTHLVGNFPQTRSSYAPNQAADLLWHAVHFLEVGGVTSVLVFTISSWQPAQLRWNACWLVNVTNSVPTANLICGFSGSSFGLASALAWQSRQTAPTAVGSFARTSALSVVVRSAGQAVLSGGC